MKQVLQITISTKEENEKTVGILEISSKKKIPLSSQRTILEGSFAFRFLWGFFNNITQ